MTPTEKQHLEGTACMTEYAITKESFDKITLKALGSAKLKYWHISHTNGDGYVEVGDIVCGYGRIILFPVTSDCPPKDFDYMKRLLSDNDASDELFCWQETGWNQSCETPVESCEYSVEENTVFFLDENE